MTGIFAFILGIGLAAACGFRVFVPLLLTNIASLLGYYQFDQNLAWMGSWLAFGVFATATLAEIFAYYIPWFDNILDQIALPLSAIAGTILATNYIQIDSDLMRWGIGAMVGGGTAGLVQSGTSAIRLASSATTGGFGNGFVSTIENFLSLFITFFSIVLPIATAIFALFIIVFFLKRIAKIAPKNVKS